MSQIHLDSGTPRSAGHAVACAFVAALGIRFALAWATPVINSDGPMYLAQAGSIMVGDFAGAIVDHSYAPGAAALIALVARCGVPLGAAGYVVSVLAGGLAVFPLYALSRAAFAPRTATAVVFLYAFLPVPARLSASVLSTGLFTFVSCLALALAAQLHARPHPRTALLAGATVAFAYAVRADGVVLMPFALASALLARGLRNGARLLLGVLVAAPLTMAASAYARYAHSGDGWTVTNKLGGELAARFVDLLAIPSGRVFGLFWEDLSEGIFLPFLPFLVTGLLVRKQAGGAGLRRVGLVLIAVWAAGLLKYTDATGIMSKRYVAPLAVLLLPWSAHGLLAVAAAIARAARGGGRTTALASAVAVWLLCASCVPKLLRVHDGSRLVEKTAGLWLRENAPPGRPLLCGGSYIPFYAERPAVPPWIARLPIDRAFYELRRRGVEFVVCDRGLGDFAPAFIRVLEERRTPRVMSFSREESGTVDVYRLPRRASPDRRATRASPRRALPTRAWNDR